MITIYGIKTVTESDVFSHCGKPNSIKELVFNNYPLVQAIHVQIDPSKGFTSVTISNLPKLTILTVEDESFRLTTNLTLSSIL